VLTQAVAKNYKSNTGISTSLSSLFLFT